MGSNRFSSISIRIEMHQLDQLKCNTAKMQHSKTATQQKCNTAKMQHRKNATQQNATQQKCNTANMQHSKMQHSKVQHSKNATQQKCNTAKCNTASFFHISCQDISVTLQIIASWFECRPEFPSGDCVPSILEIRRSLCPMGSRIKYPVCGNPHCGIVKIPHLE